MSAPPLSPSGPRPGTGRIAELDVIRGVAVMGILTMNIVGFALPEAAMLNPRAAGYEGPADLVSWFLGFVLFEGKMRGLFSFLFGASMLLVIERAEAAGKPPAFTHFSRMFWLLVFGVLHYYLIWQGDILLMYACIGMLAFMFRRSSVTMLLVAAAVLMAVQIMLTGALVGVLAMLAQAAEAPGASARDVTEWQFLQLQYAPGAAELSRDMALYGGGFGDLAAHRLREELWIPWQGLLLFGWETMALFLLGMAGYRSGFLTGRWSRAAYRRVALGGIGLGIPLSVLLGWQLMADEFSVLSIHSISFTAALPFRPFMIAGYAAAIILLARRGGALVDRVGAAGRAAFSNYLGTSLLMTFIFYGWGLGLFGTVGRAQLWAFVIGACLLMLWWSKPWLERFRYGPFEWLWRSLARGRVAPMRRPAEG